MRREGGVGERVGRRAGRVGRIDDEAGAQVEEAFPEKSDFKIICVHSCFSGGEHTLETSNIRLKMKVENDQVVPRSRP